MQRVPDPYVDRDPNSFVYTVYDPDFYTHVYTDWTGHTHSHTYRYPHRNIYAYDDGFTDCHAHPVYDESHTNETDYADAQRYAEPNTDTPPNPTA